MDIAGCRVGLCDWSLVKNRFGELANKCDLKFCNNANQLNNGVIVLGFAAVAFVVRYAVMRI